MKDIVTRYETHIRKFAFWLGALLIIAGTTACVALVVPLASQSVASIDTALMAPPVSLSLGINAAPGACDSGTITLSWPSVSSATEYRVYRDTALIYTGNNTNVTDSKLLPGSVHTYNLAVYAGTTGIGTATVVGTAPSTCPTTTTATTSSSVPQAPNGLSILQSACGVPNLTLSWQEVIGATGYKVMRNGILVSDSPNLQYIDHSLSLATSYSYTVYAYNTYGVSTGASIPGTTASSCTVTTTTSTTSTTTSSLLPPTPTSLKAQIGSCGDPSVKLSWQGVSTNYGYKIYRNDALIATVNGNSNADLATTPTTKYLYAVYAVNAYGTSQAATVQAATPPQCVAGATTTTNTFDTGGTAPSATTQPTTAPANTVSTAGDATTPTTQPPTTSTDSRKGETTQPTAVPVATTAATKFSTSVEDVGAALQDFKRAASETESQFVFLINKNADSIIAERKAKGGAVETVQVYSVRDELLKKVHNGLAGVISVSAEDITNLKSEVEAGIYAMRLAAGDTAALAKTSAGDDAHTISNAASSLTTAAKKQSASPAARDIALLYKDSNNDGISDYDSVHIYNLNPKAPTPVSEYNGKKITAAEKVLLGFDPAKKELVTVTAEEPASSTAPVVSTYKVHHIDTASTKQVVFKGRALPNTFLTLYIYSTPIVVTVKANADGEWQYTLDKELESGNHTIYTATVNNSGKILAKSPGFLFTKTAEAAPRTQGTSTPVIAETTIEKPGLLEGSVPLIGGSLIVIIVGAMLLIAGRVRNKEASLNENNTTDGAS